MTPLHAQSLDQTLRAGYDQSTRSPAPEAPMTATAPAGTPLPNHAGEFAAYRPLGAFRCKCGPAPLPGVVARLRRKHIDHPPHVRLHRL